jgi:Zn-dependent protease
MTEKKSKTGWGLFGKFGAKFLTYLPKLLKMTKLIKVGLLAISFASYAYLFTWKFALLIIIALGFHESSHVVAMKHKGFRTKGFYFIPFLGGAAIAEDKYKTYADNAFIALAGPIGGLVLAIGTYVAYLITGLPMLAAAAGWMAMLNLFNCFPLGMLDGGQVMKAIAMSISEKVGMACMSLCPFRFAEDCSARRKTWDGGRCQEATSEIGKDYRCC